MNIEYPAYALSCLRTIEEHGFEGWFVGGCVRDALIGRSYNDIDITTNAQPDQIEQIFENTVPTGKKHGTVTVIIDGKTVEVTTYRSEVGYADHRHPDQIEFRTNVEDDLSRRDFTINALAYHPERGLLDLFGGMTDMSNKVLRTVGDAKIRFNEDALRILRAFRFASVLGYELDQDTLSAAFSCGELLSDLSGERVLSELKKLSSGNNPYIIKDFINAGHLQSFGINSFTNANRSIIELPEEYKLSAFISLTGHTLNLVKDKLKAGGELLRQLSTIDKINEFPAPKNRAELKTILNFIGEKYSELYISYIKVIYSAKTVKLVSKIYNEVISKSEPYLIKHLAISGDDLLTLGIKGRDIGISLNLLLKEVIAEPALNTRESLFKTINKIM